MKLYFELSKIIKIKIQIDPQKFKIHGKFEKKYIKDNKKDSIRILIYFK